MFVAAIAALGLCYGAAMAAPGEADGCYTNSCKDIEYWISCDGASGPVGLKNELEDCIPCGHSKTRCDTGTSATKPCNLTDTPNGITFCDAGQTCDCDQLEGTARYVEAYGNYTGDYGPSQNRRICGN